LFIRFLPMIAMWEIKGVTEHGRTSLQLDEAGRSETAHA
jgi:hypothetical protein